MIEAAKLYYTPEEYLALEAKSTDKHEYYRGQLYLMAGAQPHHDPTSLGRCTLRGGACEPFPSDYKKLPSLQNYILVDQARAYIQYYVRRDPFWYVETVSGIDQSLHIPALHIDIPLAAIYERVELTDPAVAFKEHFIKP